ncbi:ABC transporter substrate-binding protein [Aliiroseovarius sediminis]|uniref:ABC transporter substrate-binding protein n=1 Tax=Aliiroseovarius sediminis TaxID=2925839 RepID=UPI001F58E79E|nr:ABC transporter substrate-binding protein [Aliiroseovarius sediminis]MCI2395972.1 ABC transporter substrate-binding protein [Aliiroseovarius sediminis]
MKRLVKTIGAAAIGAVTLQMGTVNAAVAQDLTPVEVLLPIPEGFAFTPLIVAREMGYFAEEGIDVSTVVADGSGYLSQQIVAGNSQFALMGAADAVVAFNRRDDIRVLFCNQVKNVYRIVARADSGVTSMADLEGKSLGYTEPGGGESQLVSAAIEGAGLEVNRTITLLPIGPAGPQSLIALQNDTVQAYSSSFPDVAVLAASGIDWIDITPKTYSNVPGACMVTTEEVLASEDGMSAATALSNAWVHGQYYAIENPDAAFALVCDTIEAACENETVAQALYVEAMNLITPPEGQRPGELTLSSWQTVVDILASSETVSANLDVMPLISGDNVQAVIDAAYADR